MQKTFVLDTNILIGTSGDVLDSLFATDNHVVITHTTLDELDRHKGDPGERGYAVRESIRKIFAFKDKRYGDYENGYHTPGGGTFRIELDHIDGEYLPSDWDKAKNDNKILSAAAWLSHTLDEQVILITNDAGMYMDALMAGLKVQNYKDEQVNADQLYMGRDDFDISPAALQRLFKERTLPIGRVLKKKDCPLVLPNEFLTLHCGNQAPPCVVDAAGENITYLEDERAFGGIAGKNSGQRFALHALLAPADEIPLVIIRGGAGSGKTFLSLAAGLSKVYDERKYSEYDKVIITRSNTLAGGQSEDLGFLPGTLEDKMAPLLAPFYDNLKTILKGDSKEDPEQLKIQADDLIASDLVEICAFAYLRGRSIPNSYMIIDEAQNLTVNQVRTACTRAAMGTKLVFLGDINQIDAPRLDKRTCGLSYLSEKFKGNPLCAQVMLTDDECVRSPLATEAAKIL